MSELERYEELALFFSRRPNGTRPVPLAPLVVGKAPPQTRAIHHCRAEPRDAVRVGLNIPADAFLAAIRARSPP